MGRYVGNKWHEELADPGGGGEQGNNVPVNTSSEGSPTRSNGSAWGDPNDQSVRADMRNAGYYIDNTGIYAPGSGRRVGDTWSGANAGNNESYNNVFLPILNGTPISPWAARTVTPQEQAAQPGAMSMSDPAFASLFGPGSYFAQQGNQNNYGFLQPYSGINQMSDFVKALTNPNYGQTPQPISQSPLSTAQPLNRADTYTNVHPAAPMQWGPYRPNPYVSPMPYGAGVNKAPY